MVESWSSKSISIGSNPIILIFKLMLKKGLIKLRIYPCKANPSPPIGPVLGQKGINIISFCKDFNNITENLKNINLKLNVFINYYENGSYNIFIKNPSLCDYIKDFLKFDKFSNDNKNLNYLNYLDFKKFIINKSNDFNVLNYYSILKFTKSFLKSINLKLNYEN